MPQARMPVKRWFSYLVPISLIFIFSFAELSYSADAQSWIKADKSGLIKDGKPFKFIGANAVNFVFYDDWDLDVEKAIKAAKENNISVLRFYIDLGWGKTEDFDRISDIASKYGVYIILVFTDCCCSSDYSSIKKYFEVHAPFCNITNEYSVKALKKLIKGIIERKNTINGKLYRDDSTILAWEIANELEYWRFSETEVKAWIDDIATYIKSLDQNHLVTIGIGTNDSDFNNSSPIYRIYNVAALDFFSFHFYPNLPLLKENSEKIKFISEKLNSLGKPVIMEECGFSDNIELKNYLDAAFSSGCSGAMFWGWGVFEERDVPMWWSKEGHSTANAEFHAFIKDYQSGGK